MKQKYSFSQCYQILRINPNCSWVELRKSYKTLIQKWHPDRYKEGSDQKIAANEKIKSINIAYNQLLDYFKQNGALPVINGEALSPRIKKPENAREQSGTNPQHTTTVKKKTGEEKKSSSLISLVIGILTIIVIFTLFDPTSFTTEELNNFIIQKPQQSTTKSHSEKDIINKHVTTPTPSNQFDRPNSYKQKKQSLPNDEIEHKTTEEVFFTYGSTIGSVINIQGPPDRIENDVWYYGNSKVYFFEGKVTKWERRPGTPLKANIILNDHQ